MVLTKNHSHIKQRAAVLTKPVAVANKLNVDLLNKKEKRALKKRSKRSSSRNPK
jgi:hypothetical protein